MKQQVPGWAVRAMAAIVPLPVLREAADAIGVTVMGCETEGHERRVLIGAYLSHCKKNEWWADDDAV